MTNSNSHPTNLSNEIHEMVIRAIKFVQNHNQGAVFKKWGTVEIPPYENQPEEWLKQVNDRLKTIILNSWWTWLPWKNMMEVFAALSLNYTREEAIQIIVKEVVKLPTVYVTTARQVVSVALDLWLPKLPNPRPEGNWVFYQGKLAQLNSEISGFMPLGEVMGDGTKYHVLYSFEDGTTKEEKFGTIGDGPDMLFGIRVIR